jgi:hypothetical protein
MSSLTLVAFHGEEIGHHEVVAAKALVALQRNAEVGAEVLQTAVATAARENTGEGGTVMKNGAG